MVIFLTSNKKKQIIKSIGKTIFIFGSVFGLSYLGISYLESNKQANKEQNNTIIVDNTEAIINSETNNNSALENIEIEEEAINDKKEYIAPERVFSSGEWEYYVLDGNNVICGYTGTSENVTLPLQVSGMKFTTFDKGAFFYNENVKTIEIPVGYKEIPSEAFIGCKNLTKVIIPETVTTIKGHAFDGCESMEELNISHTIETIEPTALMGLTNLKTITVAEDNPNYSAKNNMLYNKQGTILLKAIITSDTLELSNDLQTISNYAIVNSDKLKKLILPEYLIKICSYAIYECPNLEEINLPASVKTIEEYAFYGSQIKNFSVEKRNAYYDNVDGILYNKAKDKIITFPSGKTGEYTLNENTKYISSGAFVNVSITRLNIPDTFYQISFNSFIGSKKLTIYTMEENYYFLQKCQQNWNVSYKGKIVYKE